MNRQCRYSVAFSAPPSPSSSRSKYSTR
uniref:Uncharacterized protein n=1 Tax=Arundo donax TaxID=35708 RepID=A0A0A9GPD7_ARUDO